MNDMKNLVLTIALSCVSVVLNAQTAWEEIQKDLHNSASNHLAYPGPKQAMLTPAPEGKSPFYISHYGRHGSRYLVKKENYERPCAVLARADSAGALTALGRDVLRRVRMLCDEADMRWGELSPLGAVQHRQIARRMYERFPEVFDGDVCIDAKSTVVIRCILSMENALMQLVMMNPRLRIRHDASHHDMYYMNLRDTALKSQRTDSVINEKYKAFARKYDHSQHLMSKLFSDEDYVKKEVDVKQLSADIFTLASNIQSLEARKKVTLYDLYSDKELYDNWKVQNANWYIYYGGYKLNGGTQPYSQRNLLRRIIEEADSCIQLERPGATLRFGHETMVLPLTCLLELDNYGLQTDNLESLEHKGWINYRVFPMGANVQFVFYRKDLQDKDVLVKVLLNENEATLPIKTDDAPYYKWSDVRDYYLKKLDAYHGK